MNNILIDIFPTDIALIIKSYIRPKRTKRINSHYLKNEL